LEYTPTAIMDAAILLEEGDKIILPFRSLKGLESFSTQLYKVRTAMRKSILVKEADKIDISRHTRAGKLLLVIQKLKPTSQAFILTTSGECKPLVLKQRIPTTEPFEEFSIPMFEDDELLPSLDEAEGPPDSCVQQLNTTGTMED
jgi:hypothetical protein